MHSRSFDLGEATSIDRIRSLRLPCNLSSLRPDTRLETKPTKLAGFGSAGVGHFPGNSIRLPAQVQVRYLLLFFDRFFTRPTDQPRHAVCSSNHQSKPVHPQFVERGEYTSESRKSNRGSESRETFEERKTHVFRYLKRSVHPLVRKLLRTGRF